jgi:hypothetical protein
MLVGLHGKFHLVRKERKNSHLLLTILCIDNMARTILLVSAILLFVSSSMGHMCLLNPHQVVNYVNNGFLIEFLERFYGRNRQERSNWLRSCQSISLWWQKRWSTRSIRQGWVITSSPIHCNDIDIKFMHDYCIYWYRIRNFIHNIHCYHYHTYLCTIDITSELHP